MNGNLFGPQAVVTFGCTILDFFLNMNGTQNVRSSEKEKMKEILQLLIVRKPMSIVNPLHVNHRRQRRKIKVGQETLKTQKSN